MKFVFSVLYIFSIASYFMIGQIRVMNLPINLNIISIVLLFLVCLFIEKPKFDKWMIMYLVFLGFYAVSALVTGFFGPFFHRLYSCFFMSFVICWATSVLIRKFNSLTPLIYTVIFIAVIDVFVTVSQAYGLPIRNSFLAMLSQNTEQEEFLAAHGNALGYSISGLYVSPVINGHHLLFFFLVSLLAQYERFNSITMLFTLFIFVGIFYCQQRSAFFFSIIAFVFLFYNRIRKSKFRILIIVLFVVAMVVVYGYLNNFIITSGSRLSQTSSGGRDVTIARSLGFLNDHLFFGGYDLCVKVASVYSHNLFLSAFIAGGLLGGVVLLVLVGDQLLFIIRRIRCSNNLLYYIVGIMYFCVLGDSMFHNTGLVEMDFSTFIIWGVFSTIMKNELNPNVSLLKRK